MSKPKYWSGIGSRQTPKHICDMMTKISSKLAEMDYTLRSGGAIGADQAFERGAPWGSCISYKANDATPEAIELAAQFHPAWHKCNQYAKKLHGRNMMILLGPNLDEQAEFIICWTLGGKVIGGSGQCLRAAEHYKIRITNLGIPEGLAKAKKFLEGK